MEGIESESSIHPKPSSLLRIPKKLQLPKIFQKMRFRRPGVVLDSPVLFILGDVVRWDRPSFSGMFNFM